LDLNSTIENPIILLKNLANGDKETGESFINIVDAKSKQKKVRVPKIKKDLLLPKTEIKPRCSLSLPKWHESKLQKLSAEKLKEKCLVWVPKGRIQTQKDNAQVSGATKKKEGKRFKKQLSSSRFAPNCQNYWSCHYPYSLPMPM
jgi:hypothetical protein